ncbi:MAG TPA: hypothetical protein VG184_03695 [Acidimicrobiales bacterium]|nr:hypothetical protein [Acidimicrobiales bacterium]
MSSWSEVLVAECRSVLEQVRSSAPDYAGIRVEPVAGPSGYRADGNIQVRAKCLWAVQYEPRPFADPVLEELFRAEIAWHRQAPFQGYSDQLKLAAYLVALGRPEGVLSLMWTAKGANFDTWCGFDSRFLGVGGVSAAIEEASAAEPVDTDLLRHLVGDSGPRFSDNDVATYLDEVADYFPAQPSDEPPSTWFERARLLGDTVAAREALDDWVRSDTPPSDDGLQHNLASIGYFGDAVAVQLRVVAANGGERAKPLAGIRLAELQRKARLFDTAFDSLKRTRRGVNDTTDKNGYVRRRLAEEGFLLAAGTEGRLARRAFILADEVAQDRTIHQVVRISGSEPSDEWLPLVVLEAGADAATNVGEHGRADEYRDRASRERQRIRAATGDAS